MRLDRLAIKEISVSKFEYVVKLLVVVIIDFKLSSSTYSIVQCRRFICRLKI